MSSVSVNDTQASLLAQGKRIMTSSAERGLYDGEGCTGKRTECRGPGCGIAGTTSGSCLLRFFQEAVCQDSATETKARAGQGDHSACF